MKYLDPNHDDTLVIFIRMINTRVKRGRIDIDSTTDILYFDVLQKLRLLANDLTPMIFLLMRFMGYFIYPLGTISLHVTFGDEPYTKTVMIKFTVATSP